MMLREKQIEELGKIICGMENGCDGCMWNKARCNERNYAEEIYKAGYRKQSEVVKEIFEEINNMPHHLMNSPYALDLIKELTDENEKECTGADSMIDNLRDDIKALAEECRDFKIRALRTENETAKYKDRWETFYKDFKGFADNAAEISRLTEKLILEIKADTVKKMQKKIRAKSEYGTINISSWQLDQIAKEMLEENNGIH